MNLNAASCDTSDSFYHKYSLIITGLTICKLVMRDIVHILYMQNVERTEKKYAFTCNGAVSSTAKSNDQYMNYQR